VRVPEAGSAAEVSAFPLYDRFPGLAAAVPRRALGMGPSPVSRLSRLSSALSETEVWLKDDGVYGCLYGGNKTRKLEFVIADALKRRSRTILTAGGIGTNHGLATAIYGADADMNVGLFLGFEEPTPEAVQNLLVTASAGAEIHYTGSYPMTALQAPYWVSRYWLRDRRRPYILGPGGSGPLAALGYANAGLELGAQVERGELPTPDSVFIPLGTGGTVAGLLVGLRLAGLSTRVIAVSIGRAPTTWRAAVMNLARGTLRLVAREAKDPTVAETDLDGLEIRNDWIGGGLGQPSGEGLRAGGMLADLEGLALDQVYTAKAMAALMALSDSGSVRGRVLFWQTHNGLALPDPSADAWQRLPASLRRVCGL
jgi:D-cysteine desulfhydrase